ncbi:MAG: hypothetical protein WA893_15050, partial [Xanthobacteraceae bacterium]
MMPVLRHRVVKLRRCCHYPQGVLDLFLNPRYAAMSVRGAIMVKSIVRVVLVALLFAPLPATAQNGAAAAHAGAPGRIDFYVLSLSWSPS